MLKKAFTTAPVLTHWIPGSLLIIETDVSDYALAAILSMVSPMDNEVHPIAFHSYTFMPPELNYNVHNKELLAIFEAFKIWHHYLEGSLTPIDMVTVTSMDADLSMYPILIPPASSTFHFCHHPQPHHSQPYHAQSIIYHPSFIINGNSQYRAYSTIVSIFPIFSRLPSPLRPPLNSVK